MGPRAGELFYRLIVEHTHAECDADHIDVVMTAIASIPDRSAFIVGSSDDDPSVKIKKCIDFLVGAGADAIAMPCNTACYFLEELKKSTPVPIIDMIDKSIALAKALKAKNAGIICTNGTKSGEMYDAACKSHGVTPVFPNENEQFEIVNEIYHCIKSGKINKVNKIYSIVETFLNKCDCLVLGCTELSLLDFSHIGTNKYIIDSSKVLAATSIVACGGNCIGFEKQYDLVQELI